MAKFSVMFILMFIVLMISLLAWLRGIALLTFWAMPVGAILPWLLVIAIVLYLASKITDASRHQAATMTGLFPVFGLIAAAILALLVSFVVGVNITLKASFLWSMVVSTLPAAAMGIFLGIVILRDE